MKNRLTRVNELLRREIADVFFRILPGEEIDLSTVTVTRVETSSDLRRARVMVSIRGDHATQQEVLSRIYHQRKAVQQQVGKDVILKYTPRLSFHLDSSIEAGDRVLGIIEGLEAAERETSHEQTDTTEQTPG